MADSKLYADDETTKLQIGNIFFILLIINIKY